MNLHLRINAECYETHSPFQLKFDVRNITMTESLGGVRFHFTTPYIPFAINTLLLYTTEPQ
jgi:hypothetical protein